MKKKTSSITTTLIIILVIVVGGIFGYIYIQDKKLEENANDIAEPKEKKEEKKEEEISLEDEVVKDALNNLNNIDALDKYTDFNISTLDKYRLILTAINGLSDDQITWCISSSRQITASITIDELNKALNKYVTDEKLTIEDIINNKGETGLTVGQYGYDLYAITIDQDNSIHIIGSCDGRRTGIQQEIIETKPIKAVKLNDELYIYTKVAYGTISKTTNDLSYDYYKDNKKEEVIETVTLDGNLTWDKYDTYKQTYKKINDKYYFKSSKIDK